MPAEWRYRGRTVTAAEIVFIRQLITAHPGASRRRLSHELCQAWGWKQANGAPRDMVCRGLLLMLHREGAIELPPVRFTPRNPLARRERPQPVRLDETPITGPLREVGPLQFRQVRRTAEEPLFNSLMEQHHYLGYQQPVGEHLKYLVWTEGRPIACLVVVGAATPGLPRPFHRLEDRSSAAQHSLHRLQHTLSDSAVGEGGSPGFPHPGADGASGAGRLEAPLRAFDLPAGNLRRPAAVPRDMLPRG
jgi:Domain of unknown function (DUF4338)